MVLRTLLAIAGCCTIPAAVAGWQLDADASSLHFLSTKNAQVTEVHQFNQISGSVSDSGELTIEVPLSSVDTSIEIRDTRMQEKLFNVAEFPTATFTAAVPEAMLNLDPGHTMRGKVSGELTLHGVTAPATFDVMASRVGSDTLSVSTAAPTVLKASEFELTDGVEALKTIAGLSSITLSVPVTFSVTFKQ